MGNCILLTEYGDDEGCFTFKTQETNHKINNHSMLIKVNACGISYLDLEMKNGKYSQFHDPLPHVLGYEVAGEVCLSGEQVSRFSVGDQVVAFVPIDQQGGNANYITIDDYFVVHKPSNISDEEAAGIITAGIRSETALHSCVKLATGDSI